MLSIWETRMFTHKIRGKSFPFGGMQRVLSQIPRFDVWLVTF